MGIFSRPTMGDRMDKAAQHKWWNSKSPEEKAQTKREAAEYERDARIAKHHGQKHEKYDGSKLQMEHRGLFYWGKGK